MRRRRKYRGWGSARSPPDKGSGGYAVSPSIEGYIRLIVGPVSTEVGKRNAQTIDAFIDMILDKKADEYSVYIFRL